MLKKIDVIVTVIRSFFIQAVFNLERYQNIGFLYSIIYVLRKYIKDNSKLKDIFKRHIDIFNTQPYFSCFVMGNVIRMELDQHNEKEINIIKQSLACTYASIGDRIFWARLRVIECQITAILFAIFVLSSSNLCGFGQYLALSVFTPTLFYAFYTLYIRYVGFFYGFSCGGSRNCGLDLFNWNRIIKTLSRIAFINTVSISFIVLFVYYLYFLKRGLSLNIVYISVIIIAFLVQRFFRREKKNIFYPIGVMFFISFLLSFFLKEI